VPWPPGTLRAPGHAGMAWNTRQRRVYTHLDTATAGCMGSCPRGRTPARAQRGLHGVRACPATAVAWAIARRGGAARATVTTRDTPGATRASRSCTGRASHWLATRQAPGEGRPGPGVRRLPSQWAKAAWPRPAHRLPSPPTSIHAQCTRLYTPPPWRLGTEARPRASAPRSASHGHVL